MSYRTIQPGSIPTAELHAYMLASVAPRPICFASTVDTEGNVNLSPFSFFNAFGSKPPILVFSPARRVRDNTIKHTLENAVATREVCINVVNYDMVWQTSLASTEYEKGINEFIKAGFTPVPSELIKAPRVKESPVQMECKVLDIIETGNEGGAGNLVICEILMMHISENILDASGKIDQRKIDLVARMGGDWYSRSSQGLFEIEKPVRNKGVGIDQLPHHIRNSSILNGNNLGQLGNVEQLPTKEEIEKFLNENNTLSHISALEVHRKAAELLKEKKVNEALLILMAFPYEL